MRLFVCLAVLVASSLAARIPTDRHERSPEPDVLPESQPETEWGFEWEDEEVDLLAEGDIGSGGVCDDGNSTGQEGCWCPFPYTSVLDDCFYASKLELKWKDARQYCQRMGGDLASPKYVTAVQAYLREIKFDNYAYLGGKVTSSRTEWKYVDGTPFNKLDWGKGQPNDSGEECLVLYYSEAPGSVHDYSCEGERPFICQY